MGRKEQGSMGRREQDSMGSRIAWAGESMRGKNIRFTQLVLMRRVVSTHSIKSLGKDCLNGQVFPLGPRISEEPNPTRRITCCVVSQFPETLKENKRNQMNQINQTPDYPNHNKPYLTGSWFDRPGKAKLAAQFATIVTFLVFSFNSLQLVLFSNSSHIFNFVFFPIGVLVSAFGML